MLAWSRLAKKKRIIMPAPITFTLSDVVDVYDKYYRANYNEMLKRYGVFLKENAYDPNVMAEVLLIGNHQARLNDVKKQHASACDAIDRLAKAKPWLKTYANFEEIYKDVQCILADINYVKGLTIYDVSLRLAAMFNLWPDKVYLNAGSLEAAEKLFGKSMKKKSSQVVDKMVFITICIDFNKLRCDEIEDLLCVMGHYDVFSNLSNLDKVKPKGSLCSGGISLFRSNLLAHKLLEENWGKAPIPCNKITTFLHK